MSEDKELLKQVQSGNIDALKKIYQKYREDMFTVAVSLIGDIHAAEDALHDVFVAFASAAKNFNVRKNLKGYLISCVANRARDYQRKTTARQANSLDELKEIAITNDPARDMADSEQLNMLFKAIAKLPYQQREVFVMHAQGEVKFRKIAKSLDISIKTAQSRYRYAIEKLRQLLKKEITNELR